VLQNNRDKNFEQALAAVVAELQRISLQYCESQEEPKPASVLFESTLGGWPIHRFWQVLDSS